MVERDPASGLNEREAQTEQSCGGWPRRSLRTGAGGVGIVATGINEAYAQERLQAWWRRERSQSVREAEL